MYSRLNLFAPGSGWEDGINLYASDKTNKWNLLVDNGASDMFRIAFNSSEKFRIQTDGEVFTVGTGKAGSDYRAPIFYDSDNTGYFLDLSATHSALIRGNLRFNDYGAGMTGNYTSTRLQTIFNMGSAYQIALDGSSASGAYGLYWSHQNAGSLGGANNLASHGILIIENGSWKGAWGGGSLRTPGDIRGTEFYDYNNTGYYVNPAGTHRQNHTVGNTGHYGRFGINNSSNSTRYGISLYGGYNSGEPTYGLLFTGTSLGTHGNVTGDWATYFTMNNDQSRGWIFRRVGSGNCASISGGGIATFDGAVKTPFVEINKTSTYGTGAEITFSGSSSTGMLIRNNTGSTRHAIDFYYSSAPVAAKGWVDLSSTGASFVNNSDYRLKENVSPMTGSLDRLTQLKPSRFNFIGDDTVVDGFLAHEVEEVVPEAVSGEKDAVDDQGMIMPQGLDQSRIVPLLVGAIQELKAEVEALKQQLNGIN
jgi:hypothetical protein